ncbi:universal stress protein [Maribacter sp.]|nr:universal stress protein [Maribacter sp.]
MKTILYATDCSEHDIAILQYAYELSAKLNASLILLHVFSIPPIRLSTIRSHKYLSSQDKVEKLNILKEYARKNIKQDVVKAQIKFQVIENASITEGILSVIKEEPPHLLLVGMKDKHTARELFSGNIAKALLEEVNCPLLIVPNMEGTHKIKSIVYASDFEKDDINAISKLVEIAEPFNVQIKILHIVMNNENDEEEQMSRFKEVVKQKVEYQNIEFQLVSYPNVYDGLRNYISSNNVDIVAILEREEHGFLKKLFHKDLTKKIESNIKIPMLSFNQANLY